MLMKGRRGVLIRRGIIVSLVLSCILWVQIPARAQENSLEEQLKKAKVAIADQKWIIEKLKDNFFETVAVLNKKIDSLKATNDEQAKTIKRLVSNYLAITKELKGKIASLEATNADQTKTIDSLNKTMVSLNEKVNFLKEKAANQAKVIAEIREKWSQEISAKEEELTSHKTINEKQAKITKKDKTTKWLLGLGVIAAYFVGQCSGQ